MKKLEVKIDGKWEEVTICETENNWVKTKYVDDIRIVEQKTKKERVAEVIAKWRKIPSEQDDELDNLDLADQIIKELELGE